MWLFQSALWRECEILRGPGEGLWISRLQACEADAQKGENTHIRSQQDGCWAVHLTYPHFAHGRPGSSQATCWSSSRGAAAPDGTAHGCSHSDSFSTARKYRPGLVGGAVHLIYLWVPPGPLMTPAVSPGCGFFLPAVLSHPRPCGASGPALPWDLCLSEPFVMLTGSWGLPVAPQACGRVDGRARLHPVPWQVCRGVPSQSRAAF